MGTTLVIITEKTPPKRPKMKSMLLVALFVALPLLKTPMSTKSQLPSPNTAVYPMRPANTLTTSKPPTVSMSEEGEQKHFGDKPEEGYGSVARGSYSYELEGVTYTINWVADENGFQPTGG